MQAHVFHVRRDFCRRNVPSRSSAGQSLIATRGGLHAGPCCRRVGITTIVAMRAMPPSAAARALTVRLLFCRAAPPYGGKGAGPRVAHATTSSCSTAGVWATAVAIDARRSKKFHCQGAGCQATPSTREGRAIDSGSFLSDPLEPISAALRSSVLLERANERVDLLL